MRTLNNLDWVEVIYIQYMRSYLFEAFLYVNKFVTSDPKQILKDFHILNIKYLYSYSTMSLMNNATHLLYLMYYLNMSFAWIHFFKCNFDHKFSYLIEGYSIMNALQWCKTYRFSLHCLSLTHVDIYELIVLLPIIGYPRRSQSQRLIVFWPFASVRRPPHR